MRAVLARMRRCVLTYRGVRMPFPHTTFLSPTFARQEPVLRKLRSASFWKNPRDFCP